MSAPFDFDTLQEAADWFAQLRADDASESDRVNWRAWLERSDAHRAAWQTIEAVGRRFQPLREDADRTAARTALTTMRDCRPLTRRQALNAVGWLAAGSLLAFGTWRHSPLPTLAAGIGADHRTATGEIRALTLGDGSAIWLNTATAMNVDLQPSLRRLHLVAGEVLIDTAHDAQRAFVVDTAQGRLRALGTRFTVRQLEDATHLTVFEGAVAAAPRGASVTRIVEAGRQVIFRDDAIGAPLPAQAARQAWARGVLLADDISLKDLLAELSRYRHGHLAVAPDAAALRVMGTFPLRDPDRVLAMLEQALPITVRRTLPWWTSIAQRQGTSD